VVFGEPFELTDFYAGNLTDEMAERGAEIMRERVQGLLERARQERARL
jgi:hypothetical protein